MVLPLNNLPLSILPFEIPDDIRVKSDHLLHHGLTKLWHLSKAFNEVILFEESPVRLNYTAWLLPWVLNLSNKRVITWRWYPWQSLGSYEYKQYRRTSSHTALFGSHSRSIRRILRHTIHLSTLSAFLLCPVWLEGEAFRTSPCTASWRWCGLCIRQPCWSRDMEVYAADLRKRQGLELVWRSVVGLHSGTFASDSRGWLFLLSRVYSG